MVDATPVTSSKARTIVCAQRTIVIAKSHGIAPSIAAAQLDECAQTKGGRVDPRYEEWSYTGLRKRQEAAIAACNPSRCTSRFTVLGDRIKL